MPLSNDKEYPTALSGLQNLHHKGNCMILTLENLSITGNYYRLKDLENV